MEPSAKASLSSSGILSLQKPPQRGRWATLVANLRGRIVAGLLLVLPFIVTFWIVYWLYLTLDLYVISPMAHLVVRLAEGGGALTVVPAWFDKYVAPLIGLVTIGVSLYFLGFFARSRLAGMFDNFLLRVPVVTSIYSAVSRAFQSLGGAGEMSRFKRVVLVAFPHPGMRVPAFVTSTCKDETTGKTILCIYLPTTPIPTSGYFLLVPEEEVLESDWTFEDTIQAMVSFGLTAPAQVRYFPGPASVPSGGVKS